MVRIHPDPPCCDDRERFGAYGHPTPEGGRAHADPTESEWLRWGISSAGRAPALQAGGRRFDPVILHHPQCTGFCVKQSVLHWRLSQSGGTTHGAWIPAVVL